MRINYREDEMTNFWNRVACMKKEGLLDECKS